MKTSLNILNKSIKTLSYTIVFTFFTYAVNAEVPTQEEMWRLIQQQQKVIEQLQARLEQTDKKVEVAEQQVEETREELEAAAEAIEVAQETGSSGASWADKTTLGGYGELHYNSLNDQNSDDGSGDDDLDRIDFHRFVLFIGHEFNENIRMFSEIEIEHSLIGDGLPGAVELEQGWIELDYAENHRVRAGLDILPIGLLNQTHEPNTFYGVERNKIETEIIPTTWWEAGISLIGEVAPGWNYDLVAHSGLAVPVTGSSAFRPRSGRLKVAEADDTDLAFTGRLRYTGIAGLELGVSGQYQRDITSAGDLFEVPATLFEGHIDYKHNSGLGLRAMYARWDMEDDGLPLPGAGVDAVEADDISGWYIEPSYRTEAPFGIWGDVGVFARFSQWDERNRITGNHKFEEISRWVTGINWWPHENVVFKFDYQNEHSDEPVDRLLDGVNLGVGFQF